MPCPYVSIFNGQGNEVERDDGTTKVIEPAGQGLSHAG